MPFHLLPLIVLIITSSLPAEESQIPIPNGAQEEYSYDLSSPVTITVRHRTGVLQVAGAQTGNTLKIEIHRPSSNGRVLSSLKANLQVASSQPGHFDLAVNAEGARAPHIDVKVTVPLSMIRDLAVRTDDELRVRSIWGGPYNSDRLIVLYAPKKQIHAKVIQAPAGLVLVSDWQGLRTVSADLDSVSNNTQIHSFAEIDVRSRCRVLLANPRHTEHDRLGILPVVYERIPAHFFAPNRR